MWMKFNEDLTRQEVYANGNELAWYLGRDRDSKGNKVYTHPTDKKIHLVTFHNPTLVTDEYRFGLMGENNADLEGIAELSDYARENEITGPSMRYTLDKLDGRGVTVIEYEGSVLEFDQHKYPSVWGPSVDTLLFCRATRDIDLSNVKTAIEIGSGSGFISKYMLEHFPNIEELTLVDLNENCSNCFYDNLTDPKLRAKTEFVHGDALKFMKENKYDLIFCNPPYIPRPIGIGQDHYEDNPYEGVGLLVHLIQNSGLNLNEGGRFLTNVSSLSRSITDDIIGAAPVDVREIDRMTVPLKVGSVLNNKSWKNYLLDGRGLMREGHDGWEYWHDISILEVKPNE
jgi:methylase of polypeptide subunit release factors